MCDSVYTFMQPHCISDCIRFERCPFWTPRKKLCDSVCAPMVVAKHPHPLTREVRVPVAFPWKLAMNKSCVIQLVRGMAEATMASSALICCLVQSS